MELVHDHVHWWALVLILLNLRVLLPQGYNQNTSFLGSFLLKVQFLGMYRGMTYCFRINAEKSNPSLRHIRITVPTRAVVPKLWYGNPIVLTQWYRELVHWLGDWYLGYLTVFSVVPVRALYTCFLLLNGDLDWNHLAQVRFHLWCLVNMVMNFRFLWKTGNFLTIWATISFSRRALFHVVYWSYCCCSDNVCHCQNFGKQCLKARTETLVQNGRLTSVTFTSGANWTSKRSTCHAHKLSVQSVVLR